MSFAAFDVWWWPYAFILAAGWLATDGFRFLGVYFGGRIADDSEALVAVRALATALVAAVIGNLVVFPSGSLAEAPVAMRLFSVAAGFAGYLVLRRSVLAGILTGEAVLLAGLYLIGFGT
ncbi:MAG: branched-chain amino acid transport [Hyphomicrobiales bacterium]|nr:MAG: branched-chain amino acid transport [Hyphomicrobiales bacterium]